MHKAEKYPTRHELKVVELGTASIYHIPHNKSVSAVIFYTNQTSTQ